MEVPPEIICYNGLHVDWMEALYILLKRFAYPCRYLDMLPRFAKPVPQLCLASNHVINLIYDKWGHLLTSLEQLWLSPVDLLKFAQVIRERGGALQNCWGYVDGTVRPVSHPGKNERVLYNGHKTVHSNKIQSVAAPNGLVAILYGQVESRRQDSSILALSRQLDDLQQHFHDPNRSILCIFGNIAYQILPYHQTPFEGANLTPPT